MMHIITKYIVTFVSGLAGWFIGNFEPTFPLIAVSYAFILWDVQSAWALGKRVHDKYPDRVDRERAKFASFKFAKVVDTIIKATSAILLMYAARKWVMSEVWDIPLDCIAAAIVIGWQGLSILENNASCPKNENDSKLWIMLRRILIDKTERHFDINLDEIDGNNRKKS